MTAQELTNLADRQVDLDVDFANEDETGYIWVWLDEARDPDQIVPGAVLALRDGQDLAMGQVIELVPKADAVIPTGSSSILGCSRLPRNQPPCRPLIGATPESRWSS